MQLMHLFPTALGLYKLDRAFTEEELEYIKGLGIVDNIGNTTSLNRNVLESDVLKDLKDFVQDSVNKYFTEVYAPSQETHLRITQSWCNYTEPGQFHHKHAHPNSFISGVLYPQANDETDKIYFYKDGYAQLQTPTKDWNQYNSNSWWMPVSTGSMFIFPSNLTHMVETVQGTDTRISLSFNTFPVGHFGEDEAMTGLRL